LRPNSSTSTFSDKSLAKEIPPSPLSRFTKRRKRGSFTAPSEDFTSPLFYTVSLIIVPNRLGELVIPENAAPFKVSEVELKDTLATFVFRYRPRGKPSVAIAIAVWLTLHLEPYYKQTGLPLLYPPHRRSRPSLTMLLI